MSNILSWPEKERWSLRNNWFDRMKWRIECFFGPKLVATARESIKFHENPRNCNSFEVSFDRSKVQRIPFFVHALSPAICHALFVINRQITKPDRRIVLVDAEFTVHESEWTKADAWFSINSGVITATRCRHFSVCWCCGIVNAQNSLQAFIA